MKKLTTSEFIRKSKKIHGNKYDYSQVNYTTERTKVSIRCLIHGVFNQTPVNHLQGQNCPICSKKNIIQKLSSTKKEFIQKANQIHKNKYDYSKVNYVNTHTKVIIDCKQHGRFLQTPNHHLRGHGCKQCGSKKISDRFISDTEEFIQKAKKLHKNKYDYSVVKYINNRTEIQILCPIHDSFIQTPNSHLNGRGCPKCANEKISIRLKNKPKSKEHKRKLRLSIIKQISIKKYNGEQIYPFFNPKACKFIEDYGKQHGYNFQHAMNGGEFYIKELGYWVDGYDKKKNVAIEYDEKHHFDRITGKLKSKDIHRMNEIKQYLDCKFIRYNEKQNEILIL